MYFTLNKNLHGKVLLKANELLGGAVFFAIRPLNSSKGGLRMGIINVRALPQKPSSEAQAPAGLPVEEM
jgi:hypothetical protein